MNNEQYAIAVEGARAFARANNSDPFAFARAMTHIKQGIVNVTEDQIYTADEEFETRLDRHGKEYKVPVYRNVKRP